MNKGLFRIYFLCLTAVAFGGLPSVAIAGSGNTQFSVGLGVEFATGDYGTGITTDSVIVPLTIDWYPTRRLEFSLEVPYIYQSNGATVAAGGIRFRRGRTAAGFVGAVNGNGIGNGNGALAAVVYDDLNQSRSGLGNVSLKAGYAILEESDAVPRVTPKVYVEFPTADKDKALGTGEFVTGLGLQLDKWFGNWHAYLEGLYNFQGRSDVYDLKDFVSFEGGVGYQATDRLLAAVLLQGASEVAAGSSELLETRMKLNYRLSGRAGIQGFVAAGLTSGSPDFGTGMSLSYDF